VHCQAHRYNTHECENKITVEQEEQTCDFYRMHTPTLEKVSHA